jgi:hypothetical protein
MTSGDSAALRVDDAIRSSRTRVVTTISFLLKVRQQLLV